jgi:hypothetical protein
LFKLVQVVQQLSENGLVRSCLQFFIFHFSLTRWTLVMAIVIYFPEHGSSFDAQLTPLWARNYSDLSCPQVNPSYSRGGTFCQHPVLTAIRSGDG